MSPTTRVLIARYQAQPGRGDESTVVPLLVSREREVAVPVAEPDVPP